MGDGPHGGLVVEAGKLAKHLQDFSLSQVLPKPATETTRTEGAPAGLLDRYRRKKTSRIRAGLFAPLRDLVAWGGIEPPTRGFSRQGTARSGVSVS